MQLSWRGVLGVMVGSAPLLWLFFHFGRSDLALPALCSMGMLGLVITIKWKLRRQVWFWITMIVIAALHVLLVLSVHWTTKWVPAVVITPFGIADCYAMLAILSAVEKFVRR